jgi:hypothetical protein
MPLWKCIVQRDQSSAQCADAKSATVLVKAAQEAPQQLTADELHINMRGMSIFK